MADTSVPIRILAIHAHPDDVEFQCAGTLGLLKQKSCHITIATMTPGDCGSAEHPADEIAAIRRKEAARAAELLDADYHCLEFRDLSIVIDNESRRRVTECLRQVRPDIVITAPPVDYMSDHEMTSRLVMDACFNGPIPNYATGASNPAAPLARIPHLYYCDAIQGIDHRGREIVPDFIVNISTTFDLKQRMLACHESQRNWLRRQHNIDEYLERSARWSAARGSRIGAAHGEAFLQHLGHPYPHSNWLLELVQD